MGGAFTNDENEAAPGGGLQTRRYACRSATGHSQRTLNSY